MELTKLAALAIRQLDNEKKELEEKIEIQEEAVKLAFSLYKEGHVPNESLESKIVELSTKSLEELKMIKGSIEFAKTANFTSFKVSQDDNENMLDAKTQFINFLTN